MRPFFFFIVHFDLCSSCVAKRSGLIPSFRVEFWEWTLDRLGRGPTKALDKKKKDDFLLNVEVRLMEKKNLDKSKGQMLLGFKWRPIMLSAAWGRTSFIRPCMWLPLYPCSFFSLSSSPLSFIHSLIPDYTAFGRQTVMPTDYLLLSTIIAFHKRHKYGSNLRLYSNRLFILHLSACPISPACFQTFLTVLLAISFPQESHWSTDIRLQKQFRTFRKRKKNMDVLWDWRH